jgi:flagellar motor switch protein FliM
MLDCLLGGGKQPCGIPERPCTELEQRLTTRIADLLLNELHDAWEPVLAVNLTVDRIESNAQRVRLIAPSEPVIALTFQVRVAEQSGDLTLCLPTRAIRKMVDKLLVGEYCGESSNVARVPPRADAVELVARVVTQPLSSRQWSELKVGDILMTDIEASGVVEVLMDGELAYTGQPGAVDGRRAVELVEAKAHEERAPGRRSTSP